ncbi:MULTISPECIES: DUF1127 domain-containing protein [Pseudomonas]|uniref:DUF1127 domain-containing protein n=1 Tax=Pseudomonas TaxID=286 RepID=UPI00257B5B4B|nr:MULTISPECIES: DUF1127 domain-containing protein [Pseudomonas]
MRDSIESCEELVEPVPVLEDRRPRLRLVPAAPVGEGRWVVFWRALRTRKALLSLSRHALHDIGLSRADALAEAEKSLWTLWREAGQQARTGR